MYYKSIESLVELFLDSTDSKKKDDVTKFLIRQIDRMPDYYGFGIKALVKIFILSTVFIKGSVFYNLPLSERIDFLNKLKTTRIPIIQDFLTFFNSLIVFSKFS